MVFLLLICLLASVQFHAEAKTCTEVIKSINDYYPPKVKYTRKCFNSIPYNKTEAAKVIDSVQKTYEFWPYLDIAKNAPDPALASKVDVIAELKKLKSKNFTSAFSFHKAVYDVINSLNDGHSLYYPYCFAEVQSVLPVSLFTYVENGTRVFKIAPFHVSLLISRLSKPLDVKKYWDATIHKIDGVDAADYLVNYAKKRAGVYKDVGARFNSLFGAQVENTDKYNPGSFSVRYFPTDEDNVTLEVTRKGFTSKEVITLSFFSVFPGLNSSSFYFSSAMDYYNKYCFSSYYKQKEVNITSKNLFMSKLYQPINVIKATMDAPSKTSLSSFSAKPVLVLDGFVQAWFLPDNKTGVVIISTFSPDGYGSGLNLLEGFMFDFSYSCQILLRLGATRLIIDLQNNPGGYSILPDIVIQYLFPSVSNKTYNLQFRASSLSQKLVKYYNTKANPYSTFHYASWANTKNVPFNTSKGFFFPVISKTLGGKNGNYSSFFRFQSISIRSLPKNAAPLLPAENILLLTNGLCYSACGSFTYRMEEFAKVRTVTVGGFRGVPMAYSAGTSGIVYSLNDLLFYDLQGLFNNEPNRFSLSAYLGFTLIQSYSPSNSSVPADYLFKPSTYRLPYSRETVFDNSALWAEVAKFF